MSKIYGISETWGASAAVHSALEDIKDDYEVIVLFRRGEGYTVSERSANLTNSHFLWMIEEVKARTLAGCFSCRCEECDNQK